MSTEADPVMELVAQQPTGLSEVDRVEIDIQIATAKKYPRVISRCMDSAMQSISHSREIAEKGFYVLRLGGDTIMGPSVRLAEIIATNWENLEYGSAPLEITDKFVRAIGFCRDREKNISYKTVKTRSIVDKYGKTYKEHLIQKTMLAAQAIAERDAICKVVPRVYVQQLYDKAQVVAEGGDTIEEQRKKIYESFKQFNVKKTDLFKYVGIDDERDLGVGQLRLLRGLFVALRDNETTMDEAFQLKNAPTDKPTDKPEPKQDTEAASELRKDAVAQIAELSAKLSDLTLFDEMVAKVAKKQKIDTNVEAWPIAALTDLLVELRKEKK